MKRSVAAFLALMLSGLAEAAHCTAGPLTGEATRVRDGDTSEVAGIVS